MKELAERQAEYILVGAVALTMWGIVRATADVDLFLPRDAKNLERIKDALRAVWNDPEIDSITSADLSGDYGVVRYAPPDGDLTVDLLTHLGEKFRYEDLRAQIVQKDGVAVRVATPETLFRMKKDTLREQDRFDAARLQEEFGLKDE